MPSTGKYKEVSSVSWAGDYQARRAAIRYREPGGKQTRFVHTLNGSALATSRLFPAILEQFQQPDGSVLLPEVLRDRLGTDRLTPADRSPACALGRRSGRSGPRHAVDRRLSARQRGDRGAACAAGRARRRVRAAASRRADQGGREHRRAGRVQRGGQCPLDPGRGDHHRVVEGVAPALREADLVPAVPGDVAAGEQQHQAAEPGHQRAGAAQPGHHPAAQQRHAERGRPRPPAPSRARTRRTAPARAASSRPGGWSPRSPGTGRWCSSSEASAYAIPNSAIDGQDRVSRGARATRARGGQPPAGEQPAAGRHQQHARGSRSARAAGAAASRPAGRAPARRRRRPARTRGSARRPR